MAKGVQELQKIKDINYCQQNNLGVKYGKCEVKQRNTRRVHEVF